MDSRTGNGRKRDPYYPTSDDLEAVGALEATARFLEAVRTDPAMWKWAIIAMHNAVQGFMVLALRGTWDVGVLEKKAMVAKIRAQRDLYQAIDAGDEEAAAAANDVMLSQGKLADFLELYARIKRPTWPMISVVMSKAFKPEGNEGRCMKDLNRVRNEFLHFPAHSRHSYLLIQFPAMIKTGLRVITFLLNDSGSIIWSRGPDREGLKPRSDKALAQVEAALAQLDSSYIGLPLPAPPLCGSQVKKK